MQRADTERQQGIDVLCECDTGEQSVDANDGSTTSPFSSRPDQFKSMAEIERHDDQRTAIAVADHMQIFDRH